MTSNRLQVHTNPALLLIFFFYAAVVLEDSKRVMFYQSPAVLGGSCALTSYGILAEPLTTRPYLSTFSSV